MTPAPAFQSGAAQALPIASASVDAVVSGLVLNFTPDPAASLAEMARVARPGGTVAAYVWGLCRGHADASPVLGCGERARSGRTRLGRGPPLSDLPERGAARTLAGMRLAQIECRDIDVPTSSPPSMTSGCRSWDGQGPAPTYCGTLAEDARGRFARSGAGRCSRLRPMAVLP